MKYHGEIYGKLWDKCVPLDKRSEQIDELVKALEEIKSWDNELHDEWGDPGERAKEALRKYNQTPAEFLKHQ